MLRNKRRVLVVHDCIPMQQLGKSSSVKQSKCPFPAIMGNSAARECIHSTSRGKMFWNRESIQSKNDRKATLWNREFPFQKWVGEWGWGWCFGPERASSPTMTRKQCCETEYPFHQLLFFFGGECFGTERESIPSKIDGKAVLCNLEYPFHQCKKTMLGNGISSQWGESVWKPR